MALKMLVAICILGAAFGANVCEGESCSLQDDNTDLVQTRLNGENKTKSDKKPAESQDVKAHEKSTATHHVRHHEASKSGAATKSKETTASKEADDCGSARGGKGCRRRRPVAISYVDYYYYTPQQWLANMSFTLTGLEYDKIVEDGELHFGVLWNLKSEIADGFGVPFENVSIFMSDGDNGFLDVAAVIVAAQQSLQAVPTDIDTEIVSRLNTIPNIEDAKPEGGGDIGFTVKVDRLDGGVATPKPTEESDEQGRRRRSPATHAPSATPTLCLGNYLGYGVAESGAGSNGGQDVEFSCSGERSGETFKYPLSGKVQCSSGGSWGPFSSGTATSVNNWGCGVENSCWERPLNNDGTAMANANADSPVGGALYTQVPFPPVAPSAYWCPQEGGQSQCCNTGFVLKDNGVAMPGGIQCSATDGTYTTAGALTCAPA